MPPLALTSYGLIWKRCSLRKILQTANLSTKWPFTSLKWTSMTMSYAPPRSHHYWLCQRSMWVWKYASNSGKCTLSTRTSWRPWWRRPNSQKMILWTVRRECFTMPRTSKLSSQVLRIWRRFTSSTSALILRIDNIIYSSVSLSSSPWNSLSFYSRVSSSLAQSSHPPVHRNFVGRSTSSSSCCSSSVYQSGGWSS